MSNTTARCRIIQNISSSVVLHQLLMPQDGRFLLFFDLSLQRKLLHCVKTVVKFTCFVFKFHFSVLANDTLILAVRHLAENFQRSCPIMCLMKEKDMEQG